MATRNQIDVSALETLGARRLAELLQAATAHDTVTKSRLRLEIAAAEGPGAAAGEIRKRLAAIGRARKFVPRSQTAILAEDLEFQREAIQKHVAERDAGLALELLWRFMSLAERVFDRCDDSYGLVGDVYRSGLADLGCAAAEARPDPVKLANRTFEALWRNGFGQYDGLIGQLASGLGESGLEHLRLKVLAFRDGGVAAAQEEARENVVTGPWVGSRERRDEDDDFLVTLEYAIPQALKDIADARGDVDAFIEQYDERERRIPAFAAEIASRLLEANRAREALRTLDEARLVREGGGPAPDREWRAVRIEVLDALGRGDEAQAARWRIFEQELNRDYLRAYFDRLDESEADEAAGKALKHAEGYANVHAALRLLLEWPDLSRAAEGERTARRLLRAVERRRDFVGGRAPSGRDPCPAGDDRLHPRERALLSLSARGAPTLDLRQPRGGDRRLPRLRRSRRLLPGHTGTRREEEEVLGDSGRSDGPRRPFSAVTAASAGTGDQGQVARSGPATAGRLGPRFLRGAAGSSDPAASRFRRAARAGHSGHAAKPSATAARRRSLSKQAKTISPSASLAASRQASAAASCTAS